MLNMVIAGFGGQGILFTGKLIAHAGLMLDKNVSWLPSYGPEMRGGTANCSVCVADEEISSPIVTQADVVVAMNLPSYKKFLPTVKSGGILIYDSSLIDPPQVRDDIKTVPISATSMAQKENLNGLANIIILGCVLKHTQIMTVENIVDALLKIIPERKKNLIEPNIKALNLGFANLEENINA